MLAYTQWRQHVKLVLSVVAIDYNFPYYAVSLCVRTGEHVGEVVFDGAVIVVYVKDALSYSAFFGGTEIVGGVGGVNDCTFYDSNMFSVPNIRRIKLI